MDYYFKPSALKQLKKLPKQVQRRILQKLDFFVSHHDPLKFADTLLDPAAGDYRYRIGDYRVIFDVDKNKIIILIVGNRKDIYR